MNLEDLFSLRGRVALVTGGYGWLGTALVAGLVATGARVVVGGRDGAKYDAWRAGAGEGDITFAEVDVEHAQSVERAFSAIVSRHGRLDVLVNNAFYGASAPDPAAQDDETFFRGIDGTLGTVQRCTRAAIPYLRDAGGGSIVNVASMYGLVAPDFAAYAASPAYTNPPNYGAGKAGVLALTRWYASYLGPDNIRVNALVPGAFPSEAIQRDTAFVAELARRAPLGRIGRPEELAGAVAYLASGASSFVTGTMIVADGGWTSR